MNEQSINDRFKQIEERMDKIDQNNKNLGSNLKFLRDLVEECVHLTEQSSGIVVEHVTTLDSRLNSVGELFADKIKHRLEKALEALDEVDKSIANNLLEADKVAE